MKKLTFIWLTMTLLPMAMSAQVVSDFSNGIFKKAEIQKSTEADLHISDFSYQSEFSSSRSGVLEASRTKPFVAFTASALVPGAGQALNGKWARAGVYFAIEAAGIIYHLDRNAKARRQEKAYEAFTHKNWSVLAYAEWLVEYSQANGLDNDWQTLQANIEGQDPDFSNTTNDWGKVNINLLHQVENQTPFVFENKLGIEFSHTLPEYGSQQYYELISKYYQFQAGWQDFYNVSINMSSPNYDPNHTFFYGWQGRDEPNTLFYQGRDRAQTFNDNYRAAGNILKLLLVNHVVSAFDALFTVQLKNSRIESNTNLMKMEQFSLTWHF
jgi:hypothetical protein|tara:strand:+ start:7540 stop:8517 length:978 start_codon:yes stop_codon:yes gene_type:complete